MRFSGKVMRFISAYQPEHGLFVGSSSSAVDVDGNATAAD
jgi:hypothetical protein